MKYTTISLIFLLTLTLTFLQCNNCEEKYLGVINFTPTDLKTVPYVTGDTIIFKDSFGDSIIFSGSGIFRESNTTDKWYEYAKKNCSGDYYHLERNRSSLYSGIPYAYVLVSLCFGDPFSETIEKFINIQIFYEDDKRWSFASSSRFDSLGLYNPDATTISTISSYDDSLIIGSTKYYSVYTLTQNYSIQPNYENLQTVYYSVSNGIVGFRTELGHLWYLKL